jgi:hypothetical protein
MPDVLGSLELSQPNLDVTHPISPTRGDNQNTSGTRPYTGTTPVAASLQRPTDGEGWDGKDASILTVSPDCPGMIVARGDQVPANPHDATSISLLSSDSRFLQIAMLLGLAHNDAKIDSPEAL